MTTALDRLERAGYAARVRDTDDRRRVLVEITPKARRERRRFYGDHEALPERLYRRCSEQQLELLLGFVREGREFNDDHAERVERENRERS